MYRNFVIFSVLLTSVIGSQNGFLDGDLDIADGVKLVSVPVSNTLEDETARNFGSNTVLTRVAKFLQGHELHVKLPSLIEKEKLNNFFAESLKAVDETSKENAVTGRRRHGGGGGGGGIGLLGLMFAKAVGAAGIGAIGLLTMKALGAAALALLISAVVGVKKLTSHEEHHDDHQVIYAGHHGHHRRRRDIEDVVPLPYRGWGEFTKRVD